jgi:hypothetical protein
MRSNAWCGAFPVKKGDEYRGGDSLARGGAGAARSYRSQGPPPKKRLPDHPGGEARLFAIFDKIRIFQKFTCRALIPGGGRDPSRGSPFGAARGVQEDGPGQGSWWKG